MGLRPMPMFPPPGSPRWIIEKYFDEMRKIQRGAKMKLMILQAAMVFTVVFFAAMLIWKLNQ